MNGGDVNLWTGKPFSPQHGVLLEQRRRLPIFRERDSILRAVRDHSVVLIVGETGSGKTTQLPQMLMEAVETERREAERVAKVEPATSPECITPTVVHVDESARTIRVGPAAAERGVVEVNRGTRIGCTQPRRVAAMSVAQRVAQECDVVLGEEVGYHVRFLSKKSEMKTKLLYLTDGMLLREAQGDRMFSRYSVLIVDEAHERTVDTDILLGILRSAVHSNRTATPHQNASSSKGSFLDGRLRLVVMSATLDVSAFQRYFPNSPLIHIPGRVFDVEVNYAAEPMTDIVAACVEQVCAIHVEEAGDGDVLCFLTGQAEIEQAVAATRQRLCSDAAAQVDSSLSFSYSAQSRKRCRQEPGKYLHARYGDGKDSEQAAYDEDGFADSNSGSGTGPRHALVLPLYGSLSLDEQQRVFAPAPPNTRKIIFSTNIAETSVTIDGVAFVVDCGYHKEKLYDTAAGTDCLLPSVISKASAAQRCGRAGRTQRGKCFRTYTRQEFQCFPLHTFPEVLRSNLVNTLLLLLHLGVENPLQFSFIDPPSSQAFMDAYLELSYLGIVNDDGVLTDNIGKRIGVFSFVDCGLARMILLSRSHECTEDIAAMVAMREASIGGGGVFVRPYGRSREADARKSLFATGTAFRQAFSYLVNSDASTYPVNSGLAEGNYSGDDENEATSDHLTLLRIFFAFLDHGQSHHFCTDNFLRFPVLQQAVNIYRQLRTAVQAEGIPLQSRLRSGRAPPKQTAGQLSSGSGVVRKAMLEGYFTHVAFRPRNSERYKVVRGPSGAHATTATTADDRHMQLPPSLSHLTATLHRSSVLASSETAGSAARSEGGSISRLPSALVSRPAKLSLLPTWIFFDRLEVLGTSGAEMRLATVVEPEWIISVCPDFFDPEEIGDGEIAVELKRLRERCFRS